MYRKAWSRALVFVVAACSGCMSERQDRSSFSLSEAVVMLGGADPTPVSELWGVDQARVVSCMRRRGFLYLSVSLPAEVAVVRDRAWRREHGFGIVDSLRSGSSASVNPNDARIQRMAPKQQSAFLIALYGDGGLSSGTSAAGVADKSKGCIEQTDTGLDPSTVVVSDKDRVRARMRADARWVQAEQSWRFCMTQAGFRVGTFDDPTGALESERVRLGRVPERYKGERLDVLHRYELRLSNTDLECRDLVQATFDKITVEYAQLLVGHEASSGRVS
jgi:hypothetical protein